MRDRPDFPDEIMDTSLNHLCRDATCPRWRECYRFRAIPKKGSRYFDRSPREFYPRRTHACDYFIEFVSNVSVLSEDQLNGL